MSTEPRICARCGEPMETKKGKGRPRRWHPECRAAERAERARARRREQDPEIGSAERLARKLEGNEHRLMVLERLRARAALTFAGLMGGGEDAVRRHHFYMAPPEGLGWEDGQLVSVHHDSPTIIPPGAWRSLIYRAAASISAATADVAGAFIAIWREEDRSSARRYLNETIDEPEAAVTQIRALDIEARLHDALALVGPCAMAIYDSTGKVAILEALTGVPGYEPGGDFRSRNH